MSAKKNNRKSQSRGLNPEEIQDDRFLIKVGQLGGTFVARAFPKSSARSRGTLFEAKGSTRDEAVEALRAKMEVAEADDVSGRREIGASGFLVPQTREYATALRQVTLSQRQVEMLNAHAWSEAPGMTIRALAGAVGLKSVQSANTAYAKIGVAIREHLRLKEPPPQASVGEAGLSVLAVPDQPGTTDGAAVWIMHPELKAAVRSGFAKDP